MKAPGCSCLLLVRGWEMQEDSLSLAAGSRLRSWSVPAPLGQTLAGLSLGCHLLRAAPPAPGHKLHHGRKKNRVNARGLARLQPSEFGWLWPLLLPPSPGWDPHPCQAVPAGSGATTPPRGVAGPAKAGLALLSRCLGWSCTGREKLFKSEAKWVSWSQRQKGRSAIWARCPPALPLRRQSYF